MTIVDVELPKLYRKQREAIMSDHRYAVIEASPKAGKTVGCIVWLLQEAIRTGGVNHHYWWVAPVYSQTDIAFRRLKDELLRPADPDRKLWSSNESKMTVTLGNHATIWFKSADKPDTLYGEDVYAAVLDEAVRMKPAAWIAVRTTLTATGGRIRMISNVRGRRNWLWPLARKAEAGEPEWHFARLTAYDAVEAGILKSSEIDDARRVLPPAVFRELYEAIAADDEGNPFGIEAIRRCMIKGRAGDPYCWGVDLAKHTDWSVAIGLDENGRVAACERWQSDWKSTKERLTGLIGSSPALIDMTGVGDPIVEDLQRSCMGIEGYVFTGPSKQRLMEGLASAIHQQLIRIDPQYQVLISELESFEYIVKTTADGRIQGVQYSAPPGMYDDCVCALALAAEMMRTRPIAPVCSVGAITAMVDEEDDDLWQEW